MEDQNWPDHTLPSLVELFEPPSHNLCEFGDITLVIEDGFHPQLKMKVNSCILASTSKVFRTLFRGCFLEGEAIRSGAREIYMNDKPTPMLALCQLLHLKPVEPSISRRDMLDFALLVDKFDCVLALKDATDGILGHFEPGSHHDLAVTSYILDHPEHFRRFTEAIVLQSTDYYLPDADLQFQHRVIEHLPDSFMPSIIHQQDAVRNELVRCLTSILDQFTTAAHKERQPNLIFQLMSAMKAKNLWPIWPCSGGHTIPRSLKDQLASFASLEIPTILADYDKSHGFSFPPVVRCDLRSPSERSVDWGSPAPSRVRSPPTRRYDLPEPKAPTLRNVLNLSKRLEDLCVGLCLDCLKGRERCRLPHPDPWVAYRESTTLWFEQFSSGDGQQAPPISSSYAASDAFSWLQGRQVGGW